MLLFLVFNMGIKSAKWTTLPRKQVLVYKLKHPKNQLHFFVLPSLAHKSIVLSSIYIFFLKLLDTKEIKNAFHISYCATWHTIIASSGINNTSIFVKFLYPHLIFSYQSNLTAHLQALCYTPKLGKCLASKGEILSALSMFTSSAAVRRTDKCDIPLIHLNIW